MVADRGITVHTTTTAGHAVVAAKAAAEFTAITPDTTYPAPHGHGYFCSNTLATPYPCGDADTPYTDDPTFFRWQRGHATGPSPRTAYGNDLITGFHDCGERHCPTTSLSYEPPAFGPRGARPHDCGAVWFEPWTYCWGDIFGAIWDYFLQPCLTGALDGFVGTASGQIIINILNRGGQVFMDPWGYVAVAFGSCIVNVMHKSG
jgi:hypothetical protein